MNRQPLHVLITSVGRRAPLVKVFCQAQGALGGRVVTVNRNKYCAGLYVSDGYYIVPSIEDPGYLDVIEDICRKESIRLLLPTIDLDILLFARVRARFESLGITVLVSSTEVIDLCRDKYACCKAMQKLGVDVPETLCVDDRANPPCDFPFIIKERYGRGGMGFAVIHDFDEWKVYVRKVKEPVVQALLQGTEFTLDVLSDLDGRVISVVPRSRLVIRAGVSDQGQTLDRSDLVEAGAHIAKGLNLIGPSNIQGFIASDGTVRFTEINPRFSGAVPLTIAAGANFPEWILRMVAGEEVPSMLGKYKRDLFMVRYEESMFHEGNET